MPLTLVCLSDGEHLVLLGCCHIIPTMSGVPVIERLALPEGIEDVAVVRLVLLANLKGVLGTCGESVELIKNPIGAHLGRNHASPRSSASVPYEKIPLVNHNLVVLEHMAKCLGPANDGRLSLGCLIALHEERRSFHGNLPWLGKQAVLNVLRPGGEHHGLLVWHP